MAEKFSCAPSQINYVLETRFSGDHGFIIESRRGGGGFVRIIRVENEAELNLEALFSSDLANALSARRAKVILERLYEQGILSKREVTLISRVLDEETQEIASPFGDVLRAMLLRSVLFVLLNSEREG